MLYCSALFQLGRTIFKHDKVKIVKLSVQQTTGTDTVTCPATGHNIHLDINDRTFLENNEDFVNLPQNQICVNAIEQSW